MSEQRDSEGGGGNSGGAGGAWGSRGEEAAWWPASADQQALLSEEVRNAAAQHIFSYKMAGGFQTGEGGAASYECRPDQGWWYGGANVLSDHHQHQSEQTNNQQSAQASLVQQQQQVQQQALQQAALHQHALQQQVALQAAALASGAAGGAAIGAGGRRTDAKPRGRMTAYAFFVQTCREEHKRKHPEEIVVFAAFSKKCAERWNTMSEKEKQRFHEMAEQDKKRYDIEMRNYIPPRGEKLGRGRKRRQVKDPNAPKRSLSAFFWFCNDERAKVKAINPDYGVGDIAKELGRRWAAADPATKSKYDAMSEKDKARYDREMTAYKKRPLIPEGGHDEDDEGEARNHEYE